MLSIDRLLVKVGDFSLDIDSLKLPGRRNFIMGKNGSGKTTFLKSIAGILDAKSGNITVGSRDISELPAWNRKVSYIPHYLLLFPTLNVRDNIRISIKHGSGDEKIFETAVREMDLSGILGRKVWQISGGQAQRVAVARSLVSAPELLLMDEPFSMQDERARAQMLSLLYKMMDELDFSFLYVTHNTRDLEFGYDSISFIDSGKVIESVGSINEIRKFSSYSMVEYRNTIKIGERYYRVSRDACHFSDSAGYPYTIIESDGNITLSVESEGETFFIIPANKPDGKFIEFDEKELIPLD